MRYFLKILPQGKWEEVAKEQYIRAETGAGFRLTDTNEDDVSTTSFRSTFIEGCVNDKHPDEDFKKVAPLIDQLDLTKLDPADLQQVKSTMEEAMKPMDCVLCHKKNAEQRTMLVAPEGALYGGKLNTTRILFIGICTNCAIDWENKEDKVKNIVFTQTRGN